MKTVFQSGSIQFQISGGAACVAAQPGLAGPQVNVNGEGGRRPER